MGSIADSVWQVLANQYTATAGSMGDVLYDSIDALVSSAGGVAVVADADMAAIADSVWQALMSEHDNVAGSFGDSAQDWSGSDSALISRIVGRKAWGIAAGFGDDSSTISQRTVDSVGVVGNQTSGAYTVTLYAIDTSASPDDSITNIDIEIKNQVGQRIFNENTNSGGYVLFNATINDTVLAYVRALPMYNFLGDNKVAGHDTIFVTGTMTDSLLGYEVEITAPSSADLCRAYIDVYDNSGNPIVGAQIFAKMQATNVQDTCNLTSIGAFEMRGTVSDAAGRTYIDLIKSKCLLKTGSTTGIKYKIGIDYGDYIDWKFNDTIPDSTTFNVTRY
jgi:hypothetical protein